MYSRSTSLIGYVSPRLELHMVLGVFVAVWDIEFCKKEYIFPIWSLKTGLGGASTFSFGGVGRMQHGVGVTHSFGNSISPSGGITSAFPRIAIYHINYNRVQLRVP